MGNYNFKEHFNKEMSSGEALRAYTTLLKTVPKEQHEALYAAYNDVANIILRRECENVKKYGVMY